MRHATQVLVLAVSVLFSPLLPAHEHEQGQVAAVAVNQTGFGEAMPAAVQASTLAQAIAAQRDDAGDQVISGRVGKVCQKQGCWMTLSDGDSLARVMTDHKFALPKDLQGEVLVYGKLEAIDLDEKEIAHMAKDGGTTAASVPVREYRIKARGVSLR